MPITFESGRQAAWLEPILAVFVFMVAAINEERHSPWQWALMLAVCGGAALSASRPKTAAVITGMGLLGFLLLPPSEVSVAGVALFVNVFSLTRRQVERRWILIPLLLLAGYLSMVQHYAVNLEQSLSSIVVLIVLATASIGGGYLWRLGEQRIAKAQQDADEYAAELRRSLARDLHDTVAHTISNAAMRAHMVGLDPDATPAIRLQLEQIATDCSTAAQDLRQLLSALRDLEGTSTSSTGPLADAQSLALVVEEQTERLRVAGLIVDCEVDLAAPVRASRAGAMSMIVVEATNNMLKHAPPAGHCRISMTSDPNKLSAEFGNQLTPGHKASTRGLGLIGIRERTNLLNGSCAFGERDGWWLVEVLLPLGSETLDPHPEVPRRSAIG